MPQEPDILLDRGFQIEKNRYFESPIDISRHGLLEIAVFIYEGPEVDIFLTDRQGMLDNRSGDDFRKIDEFTIKNTERITYHRNIVPGRYGLIIENNGGKGWMAYLRRKPSIGSLRVTFE